LAVGWRETGVDVLVMIKQQLKAALLASIQQEIDAALEAAEKARQDAAHKDNQPENQYDTLSLEAAYLAHGQSERILQLQQDHITLGQWPTVEFAEDDEIASGALVTLESQGQQRWVWITPCRSRTLMLNDTSVQAVSVETPLAQQLIGRAVGDEIALTAAAGSQSWEILNVQ
jgi:transcription elongation GreA/GreB family factor